MAVILPNSIFIHIPKTGGCWVRHCLNLSLSRVSRRENGRRKVDFHCSSWQLENPKLKEKTQFAFVRDPFDWVCSRWAHRKVSTLSDARKPHNPFLVYPERYPLSDPVHSMFQECFDAESLDKTIENILKHYPGLVSKTFSSMVRDCGLIGKLEGYPFSLINILALAEKSVKRGFATRIFGVPKIGKNSLRVKYKLDDSLLKAFIDSESEAYSRWYTNKKRLYIEDLRK